jgi:hypothetical protein
MLSMGSTTELYSLTLPFFLEVNETLLAASCLIQQQENQSVEAVAFA